MLFLKIVVCCVLDLHKELSILTQIKTKLGKLNPSISSASAEDATSTGNDDTTIDSTGTPSE